MQTPFLWKRKTTYLSSTHEEIIHTHHLFLFVPTYEISSNFFNSTINFHSS
jgi:hypothetical protein